MSNGTIKFGPTESRFLRAMSEAPQTIDDLRLLLEGGYYGHGTSHLDPKNQRSKTTNSAQITAAIYISRIRQKLRKCGNLESGIYDILCVRGNGETDTTYEIVHIKKASLGDALKSVKATLFQDPPTNRMRA